MTTATPELLAQIDERKALMEAAREGMRLKVKYSSRSLGGHTTQYRKLCRLAGIPVIVKRVVDTPPAPRGKPCRYKACKGRDHKLHGEKCPVAAARGKTGGKAGEGESKQRLGDTNGNFKRVRPCGCPMRQHKVTCSLARPMASSKVRMVQKEAVVREALNMRPVEWRGKALSVAVVSDYLRGVRGVCASCNENIAAPTAAKVHPSDIMQNPARVICRPCDGA